ncbi:MAG: DUF427 domain-containing protein [Microscillaceae bacterium]
MKSIQKITPGPGQESVWDYPRPPKVEAFQKTIRIVHQGITLVESNRTKKVMETSHPPVYYIPPDDIQMQYLQLTDEISFCEFKGKAHYYHLQIGEQVYKDVAWVYLNPAPLFAEIKGYLAFYPRRVEACFVDDEPVQSQEGDFYGGWVTANIVGPFKGGQGTWGW